MMSLTKSFFDLTAYMAEDKKYGDFWKLIHAEYIRSREFLLELTGFQKLMENEKAGRASIEIREAIVQPLLTIQQYALQRVAVASSETEKQLFEKMVTRSMFGNINASRNSA
jgi:phosphoenolpyruvate carboxylase